MLFRSKATILLQYRLFFTLQLFIPKDLTSYSRYEGTNCKNENLVLICSKIGIYGLASLLYCHVLTPPTIPSFFFSFFIILLTYFAVIMLMFLSGLALGVAEQQVYPVHFFIFFSPSFPILLFFIIIGIRLCISSRQRACAERRPERQ